MQMQCYCQGLQVRGHGKDKDLKYKDEDSYCNKNWKSNFKYELYHNIRTSRDSVIIIRFVARNLPQGGGSYQISDHAGDLFKSSDLFRTSSLNSLFHN